MSDAFWTALFANLPSIIAAVAAAFAAIWARRGMVDTNKGRQEVQEVSTKVDEVKEKASGFDALLTQSFDAKRFDPNATTPGK